MPVDGLGPVRGEPVRAPLRATALARHLQVSDLAAPLRGRVARKSLQDIVRGRPQGDLYLVRCAARGVEDGLSASSSETRQPPPRSAWSITMLTERIPPDGAQPSSRRSSSAPGALISPQATWLGPPDRRAERRPGGSGRAYPIPMYQVPNMTPKIPNAGISTVR